MFYFTRNLCIGLVLGLLVGTSSALAEPLYPLLSTGAIDSLRALLTQSREDNNQVQWQLRLGEDFLNKWKIAVTHLDSARHYFTRAQRLSNVLRFTSGQIRSGFLLGLVTARQGDRQSGRYAIERALSASRKSRLALLEAEGWYYLGKRTKNRPKDCRRKFGATGKRGKDTGNWEPGERGLRAQMHRRHAPPAREVGSGHP